jgi:thiamine monophosphate synthase
VNAARELQAECLHLPLSVLNTLSKEEREKFSVLGASCHSVEDAIQAEQLGCTYLTAGHIFDTDCKTEPVITSILTPQILVVPKSIPIRFITSP